MVADLAAAQGEDTGTIALTWTAPANGGSDLTGFELVVWNSVNNRWDDLATPAAGDGSYSHENLVPGTRYFYTIRAQNSAGNGPWTQPPVDEIATPGNPYVIDDLTATATGTSTIDLAWTAPNNNGTPITGYELQRWVPAANNNAAAWGENLFVGTDRFVTQFTDTELSPGTKFYYRVRALPQNIDTNNIDGH